MVLILSGFTVPMMGSHLCGMTENPCNCHSGGVCAVLFADFFKLFVKLLVVRVSDECSAEETELEGRPRLNGDVIETAVVENHSVTVYARVLVHVHVETAVDHSGVGNAELELIYERMRLSGCIYLLSSSIW